LTDIRLIVFLTMSDPGCAVDADGSLKSPDNIVWYNEIIAITHH
jgi:hypothetical protein